MKTDIYIKTVLTIIAITLIILAFQNASIIPKAEAAIPSKVNIVQPGTPGNPMEVRIVSLSIPNGLPVDIKSLAGQSIPVYLNFNNIRYPYLPIAAVNK